MKGGSKDAESLTEEERRALRGSRFSSSLPPPSAAPIKPRPSRIIQGSGSKQSVGEFDLKPLSQCKRIQPSNLAGSWKVFETSATVISEESTSEAKSAADVGRPPYVYLCMETLKKRSLPENPIYFGEEELLDMGEVTVLWLPGGVTGYVDVKNGIHCIGVGWYSDEGINLVIERDYGVDGKLKEVHRKTELKRRWSDPTPL